MPTPTPPTPQAVNNQVDGDGNPVYTEVGDSGKWTVNRTFRVTLKYRMFPYDYAFENYIFYRGDLILVGANTYVISESRMSRIRPNVAEIEVDCDSYDQTPTDEFCIEPIDQNPRIERHPIFKPLADDAKQGGNLLSSVQAAYLAATQGARQNAKQVWAGDPLAPLCDQLYAALLSGMETYYLSQWMYTWTTYIQNELIDNEIILDPPTLSLGGVTEHPGGPLAAFLTGNQWLRLADRLTVSGQSPIGTVLKLTRSWLGGPNTFFDTGIYPPN